MALACGDLSAGVFGFGRTLTPVVLFAAVDGLSAGSRYPPRAMLALYAKLGSDMKVLTVTRGTLRSYARPERSRILRWRLIAFWMR